MTSQTTRIYILLLTVATGFSGLAYEVVWHRYLTNLVGSQARASAIILALFLGGLSTGYAAFGKYSRNSSPRKLIIATGALECLIGFWALLFPFIYDTCYSFFVEQNSTVLPVIVEEIVVSSLLLIFPTFLMGGTLPLLTQALSRDVEGSSRLHATLYALNTGGAFLGCISTGLFFIPNFGLPPTLQLMSLLNIVPGILFLVFSTSFHSTVRAIDLKAATAAEGAPATTAAPATAGIWQMKMVSFLAGFVSLALQVLLMRLVSITIGGSEYAFTLIVSIYILFLALGSWKLRGETDAPLKLYRNQIAVIFGFLFLYGTAITWPYLFYRVRLWFPHSNAGFYGYLLGVTVIFSILLALPVAGMGRTMPLVFSRCRSTFHSLGSLVGQLYMWNTLGCVFGAFGGGYLLLFVLDIDQITRILITLLGVTALLSLNGMKLQNRSPYLFSLALIVCGLLLPAWSEEYFAMSLYRKQLPAENEDYAPFRPLYATRKTRKLIFYEDGPNTTLSVVESAGRDPNKPVRSIWVNGKSDGATDGGDLVTTRLLGHLPLLFSQSNTRIALIGYGTGITAGAISLHPGVEKLDLIEISSAMKHTTHYFAFANHNVMAFPALNWITADAYRTLTSADQNYNVIVSGPSNPWIAGIERLYADEFYQLVNEKIESGGIFAQWMHLYAMSEKTLKLVFQTLTKNFKNVWAFHASHDLILIASQKDISFEQVASNWNRLPEYAQRDLQEIGLHSPSLLYPYLFSIPSAAVSSSPVHSLMYPRLAFSAGKDFFMANGVDPLEIFNDQTAMEPLRQSQNKFLEMIISAEGEQATLALLNHRRAALCGKAESSQLEFCKNLASDIRKREGQRMQPPDITD